MLVPKKYGAGIGVRVRVRGGGSRCRRTVSARAEQNMVLVLHRAIYPSLRTLSQENEWPIGTSSLTVVHQP